MGGHLSPIRSAPLGLEQTGHCSTRPESASHLGPQMARRKPRYRKPNNVLHQCGLCGHPQCGLAHIICACPHLTHARDGARSDLWRFATRQPPTPAARVMQRYTQLLFDHPNLDQRGQLWLGHWTPPLRQVLFPLLQPLTLREGQAALTRIGRMANEVYRDLWDCSGEAIALAQPPPPEDDFHLDTHHPLSTPQTPLPLLHGSTSLGCSASCRQRLVLQTSPLCFGGHMD